MSRKLAVLALAVGLVACGSEEAERQILLDYVQQMQKLDGKNKQIVETIEHLRKPLSEISEQDLAKARRLINDYVAELQGLVPDDLDYKELRLAHNLYVAKVAEAIPLSGDQGRELRREKSNVDIGVRHIERLTVRHYKVVDILWLQRKITDPYPLMWPSS